MQQLSKKISTALATACGLAVLIAAPVWAEQGSSSSGSSNDTSGSNRRLVSDDSVAATNSTESETDDDNGVDSSISISNREKAKELLETKRVSRTEHTATQKKKSCEARAANINKRSTNYAKQGQKHLDVFNKIFSKVQAFETDKQLDVAGYDDLVAAATLKQAAAQAAVDALKQLDVSIDCTQADPASAVATLKTATATARTALQEYRKSIKDVVVALKGASTAQKESATTESDSDTTTAPATDTTTETTTEGAAQ